MMFSSRQEVSSWYYRTAMDKDKLWQSGPQLHTGIDNGSKELSVLTMEAEDLDICFERVWVYWGAGERKKSMCCNNFHIVIFSGCHLTTAVVFSPVFSQGGIVSYSQQVVSELRFEKFDGRINFGLWQVQVKDVLIQSGLHKALKEKISGCSLYERR
ncbi:hypothetical protein Ahy_A04g017852 [Arachis hypogaea]|uniref:Uncharacterized protein n=1 Tax=Arachis hypogaea TaxID=3818 RepID=A0A445DC95_ARAHY|nr:hypothetical protein Ahy_A04g017852 [Arachis hypogaea]